MVRLNSTAACVLGLLDVGPPPPDRARWDLDATMSGAEVWNAIERSVGGFWSMTRSQVYQELRRLAEHGLVVEREHRYSLSDEGRAAARVWFVEFARSEPREEQIRSPITLTVFFGHYLPRDLLERVVREHELRYRRRLDVMTTINDALIDDRSLPGSTLQRAMIYARSGLEWMDDVLARIALTPKKRARRP